MPEIPNRTTKSGGEVDLFLKVTGTKQGIIKGESQDHKHKDEIDIQSFQWGVTQAYDRTVGRSAGKRQYETFKFVMKTQLSTPLLFRASTTGEILKEVVLTCRKAGGTQQEYAKWILSDATIVSIKSGYLSPSDLIPFDSVEMVFRKVEMDYQMQRADGNLGPAVTFIDDWGLGSH